MQGYKVSILTLAVGLLGLIELWSRAHCFLWLNPVWALGLGSFVGATFYCLARIAFFGKFVELSYKSDAAPRNEGKLMLNRVEMGIKHRLDRYLNQKSRTCGQELWKRMIKCGKTASAGLWPSAILSVIVFVVVILVTFWLPSSFCLVA